MDVLTPEQRRLNMSCIRGRDTRPEMTIRQALHSCGYRFRLHRRDLPGCPDLVFPRYRAVIFVHGCFWHGHDCPLFKWPGTRRAFWENKITRTAQRDAQNIAALLQLDWRVLILWECALRGSGRLTHEDVTQRCSSFLSSADRQIAEICGIGTHSRTSAMITSAGGNCFTNP